MSGTNLFNNSPKGLMLHHFHGDGYKDDRSGSISIFDFEKVILSIGIENFDSPLEWTERVLGGGKGYKKWCITFDDGLRCQVDLALPVLKKYGLKAFWFVCSGPYLGELPRLDLYRRFRHHYFDKVEDFYAVFFEKLGIPMQSSESHYVSWKSRMLDVFPFYTDMDLRYRYSRDFLLTKVSYEAAVDSLIEEYDLSLKDLANEIWITEKDLTLLNSDSHILGLHSHDHPTNFSALDNNSQIDQYQRNFHFLNNIVGKVFAMSHPCGSYSPFTLGLLDSLGITVGFRSNTSSLGYLDSGPSGLQIPREDVACVLRSLSYNVLD